MNWQVVIGLEIHVQLKTKTKMFCRCSAEIWDESPNSRVCSVCLGLPGALPVINKQAVEKAILAGLVFGSKIDPGTYFERKHYFYPDLPKNYQISQYQKPICVGGQVKVGELVINLERAHLEEDAGKLMHITNGQETYSLVDLNRAGIPLLEIVSKPELISAAVAKAYAQKIQQLIRYADISEADMEKGSLRVDANISLKKPEETKLGAKVEVKNMNSFRALKRALLFEIERQRALLENGERIIQETRGWVEIKGETVGQRSKEEAHDYRYFPEPDLPALSLNQEQIDKIKNTLPEMPDQKIERFVQTYQLNISEASLITGLSELADWFEEAVKAYGQTSVVGTKIEKLDKVKVKDVYNWVTNDLLKMLTQSNLDIKNINFLPSQLAEILYLKDTNKITTTAAKKVFEIVFNTSIPVQEVIKNEGLTLEQNKGVLSKFAAQVIKENPKAVSDYKSGKVQVLGFLVGAVMRLTKASISPKEAERLLQEQLK